ncbi:MAG TPA: hypothetical protein VNZ44_10105 [Pyrinomonadaceae bacterium]|nr:hypothetical protein [Pyrinomonadaceae bacterium]
MYLLRASAVWLVIVAVESAHGTLRELFLAPAVGDFRARQIAVFTGSLLILGVAYLFVRWIRAGSTGRLLAVGLLWLFMTLLFEFGLGFFVLGYSWERVASDYDLSRGGLMSFGLVLLTLAPLIAARLRGLDTGVGVMRAGGSPSMGRT